VNATGQSPQRRRRRFVRRNSVPLAAHGLIEYLMGALSISAPFLLGFDSGAATAFGVAVGLAIIVLGVVTDAPTGIGRRVPIDSHHVLDYVIGVVAILGPFMLGFSDQAGETAWFVVFGAAFVTLAFATRFRPKG
jgi:hypothetical protein